MSVYQVVGAVAGAIVGFVTENPQAGFATYAAIAGVGSYLDQPNRYGPRLEDLRSQVSSYGNNIPFEYGTNRHAGTVIWPRIIEAVEHEHSESAKGGPDNVTYTYTLSFAVLVCEGPIAGIRRIWANKKLIYDVSTTNTGAVQDPAISQVRFYLGTDDQSADPLIEATEGNTPSYHGYAYVVFEDYDVTEMNGRVPQFEFEVVTSGIPGDLSAVALGPCGNEMAIDTNTGYIWTVQGIPDTRIDFYITDPLSGGLINQFSLDGSDGITVTASMGSDIAFNPENGNPKEGGGYHGQFWISNETADHNQIIYVNADTYDGSVALTRTWVPGIGGVAISWAGLIHYSASFGKILWGQTNVNDDLFVIDADTIDEGETDPQARMALSGSVFGLNQILDLADGRVAVLAYQKIAVGAANGVSSGYDNIYPNSDIDFNAFMASDQERDRILVINGDDNVIIELNVGTGTYTNHTISFPPDIPPTASQLFRRILWHEQNDKYYVTAHQAGLDWTLYTINPNTYEIEFSRLYSGPTNVGNLLEYPNHPEFLVYTDSGTNTIWKLPLYSPIDPDQVLLSDIVTDLCVRTGLTESQIDVTDLTDGVDGFMVGRQMTARSAIEPLQQAFQFDAVESDGKIKFVKRGGLTVTTIPLDDRAAHSSGQDMPPHLDTLRAFELELPYQCDVEYADIDADLQVGNQYDRRIIKDTRQKINIQLPLSMDSVKAKQVARIALYDSWKKLTFKFSTTIKYAFLEPTDLVYLPTEETTHLAMITNRRDQPNGIIEWEARIEDLDSYTQSGADAVPIPYQPQTVFEPSNTLLALLDIPLLRDEDDNSGYYVAMGEEA